MALRIGRGGVGGLGEMKEYEYETRG
jgi:hypothetical protein